MNRNQVEQKLTMHINTLKKELYEAEPFCFRCWRCCWFLKQFQFYIDRLYTKLFL